MLLCSYFRLGEANVMLSVSIQLSHKLSSILKKINTSLLIIVKASIPFSSAKPLVLLSS